MYQLYIDQASGKKQWTSGPTGTSLTGSQQVQLQQIRDRDQEFNADLDEIGEGIQDLRELAQGMGEEVARQNVMLNTVGQKIDGAHEHIVNVNAKMKETLDEVGRSSDKLCVDIMCIVSILLLVLIIYLSCHISLLVSYFFRRKGFGSRNRINILQDV